MPPGLRLSKAWLLVAVLATATPAWAVPPVAPRTDVVKQFIAAIESNDHSAYSQLFSAGAQVTLDGGGTLSRVQWLARTNQEFTASRRTRFFTGLAGDRHFVLIEAVRDCGGPPVRVMPGEATAVPGPFVLECFDTYRRETITLTPDGKQIQALERSDFNHALSPEGDALLFVE